MAYTYAYGGDPNNTNYRTYYSNNFLYSTYGGFPAGNASSTGGNPVKIYGVGTDWSIGATYHVVNFAGVDLGGGSVISSGGGNFQHRVGHGSGELGAGRNTGNGATMTDSADGDTVTGGICGWFDWATVALAPTMIGASRNANGTVRVQFSGSGNTGGVGMTGWQLQYATNSSFSGATTIASSGTSDLSLAPGYTYWFRSRGSNDVGWSAWSGAISYFLAAGGKRYDGTTFQNTATARRFDGSNFINLATAKRFDGSTWVNLS